LVKHTGLVSFGHSLDLFVTLYRPSRELLSMGNKRGGGIPVYMARMNITDICEVYINLIGNTKYSSLPTLEKIIRITSEAKPEK